MASETEQTRKLYGLDQEATKVAGERFLAARRLVERGVRFVQFFPSAYGVWDSHQKLKENHTKLCASVDLPIAGLIADLKQRGLLESRSLEIPERKRLDIDHGQVISDILA